MVNILPHYTYDDYCLWEGRWEIIDGIPYAMSPPVIAVEVLSPSTQIKERNAKFDRYQKFGIKYYLIVDVDINLVEIFQLSDDKIYQKKSPDKSNSFTFQLTDHCGIVMSLDRIWE